MHRRTRSTAYILQRIQAGGTFLAVAKALENVSEAVKQIPAAVRRKHPDVPWKDMAGMRDVLVHDVTNLD